MHDTPHSPYQIGGSIGAILPIVLIILAVHGPALALGGNRFGFILPAAIVMIVLLALRATGLSPPRYASWLWLGVMVWGGVQIAMDLTPDRGEAARVLARFALYGAVYLVAFDIAQRPFQAGLLIKASALWIASVSAFGLIAWATGHNPILSELEAYPAPLEATFINRNAFALYAVFGLLAALCVCAQNRSGLRGFTEGGWIWAAVAVTSCAALTLTGSRGGLGAGIVGLTIFCALLAKRRWPVVLCAFALLIGGFIGQDYIRDAPILADARFAVHGQVLAETFKAPLTGHGLGAFQDTFRAPLGESWRWGDWDHAHQQYLETAYELGWPAAMALFAAILLAAPPPLRGDPITALALGALGAAAAHALVDFSLTIPAVAMTLALLLGLASGRHGRIR